MNNGSVSLRFWHPTLDLSFLSLLLELPSHRSWKSGSCRQTPKGSPLAGVNKNSYWVSRLEFSDNDGFKKQFVLVVDHLVKVEQEILKFIKSDGKIEIYFQLSGKMNHGGTIDNKYISIMGRLGIDLLVEVFP